MVVDLCKGHKSPLTGKQVPVIAAGGIADPGLHGVDSASGAGGLRRA